MKFSLGDRFIDYAGDYRTIVDITQDLIYVGCDKLRDYSYELTEEQMIEWIKRGELKPINGNVRAFIEGLE